MTKAPYDPAEAREQEHERKGHEHAAHHQPERKPLSGAEVGDVTDKARECWARQEPTSITDSLGRGWSFDIVHEPLHALRVTCDGVSLGILGGNVETGQSEAKQAPKGEAPEALRAAIADLDKAMPALVQTPAPEPARPEK
jgi:hypothetical protein